MLHDLVGNITWMEMFHLLLRGRLPTPPELRLLDSICVCTSYPDPRVWCHRAGRLGAAMRPVPGSAVGAALGALEARIFGGISLYDTMMFLQDLLSRGITPETVEGEVESCLERKIPIPGFGRPIVKGDERVEVIFGVANECGLADGPAVVLTWKMETILKAKKGIMMNYSGAVGSLLTDLGFDPMTGMSFSSGMGMPSITGTINEQFHEPPGSFLPMSCDDVQYTGPSERTLLSKTDMSNVET